MNVYTETAQRADTLGIEWGVCSQWGKGLGVFILESERWEMSQLAECRVPGPVLWCKYLQRVTQDILISVSANQRPGECGSDQWEAGVSGWQWRGLDTVHLSPASGPGSDKQRERCHLVEETSDHSSANQRLGSPAAGQSEGSVGVITSTARGHVVTRGPGSVTGGCHVSRVACCHTPIKSDLQKILCYTFSEQIQNQTGVTNIFSLIWR